MATVVITGGTGMIGTALTRELVRREHAVIILTRKAKNAEGKVVYKEWDVRNGRIDHTAIQEADYIIHLAGAGVADKRWTEKRKREIEQSRVKGSALLVKALQENTNHVRSVISASAIGWYGPDPQVPNPRPFIETDPADSAFLGATCVKWEDSIRPVASLGKRLVILRTGIVLSKEGGAYAEFKKPLKFGAATVLGTGRQVISWIHIDDLVRLYITAIENEQMHGVFNAVAPHPVTNKLFIKTIAKESGRFYLPVPVPSLALKIALGEMSIEVLKSATVSALKVQETGFQFLYPQLAAAVKNLEGKRSRE
jgi:uncharacterized protein